MNVEDSPQKTEAELEWEAKVNRLIAQAKALGYPLPDDFDELSREAKTQVCIDFTTWEDERQAGIRQQQQVFEEGELQWNNLLADAKAMGYPHLPVYPSLVSNEDRNTFLDEYREWKGRIDVLYQNAAEAREAGYGIPSTTDFNNLSLHQKGEVIKAYKVWKEERAALVEKFVEDAGTVGFPMHDKNVHAMTYVQQNQLFEEFNDWNTKQGTSSVATPNPIPTAAEALKKAKAQEELQWERKQNFKATLDGSAAREARTATQNDKRSKKRQDKANQRRMGGGNVGGQPDAAPQPPPRRTSDRASRPSQKKLDSHGENQVQHVDSFDARLDDLSHEFETDIVDGFNQLQCELNDSGGFGSSFDNES